MENKTKIIGGIAVIFLVGAVVFVWATLPAGKKSEQAPVAAPVQVATSTYATTTFSVVYPAEFSVSDSYVYDKVNPKKPIYGVKFSIPVAMATGTNLSSFDTGISVEQLPRAKNCTGDIYLAADVKPTSITENGVEYSVATSSEAAAGNVYEEAVYALVGSAPCTALRYFIHSTAIGNYDPATIREYDRGALLGEFDKIRHSLRIGALPAAAPAPAAPTPTP